MKTNTIEIWLAGKNQFSDEATDHKKAFEFESQRTGEAGAEEAFYITNCPFLDTEREVVLQKSYGEHRLRSVSVGDIVSVDGERFQCRSSGWAQL